MFHGIASFCRISAFSAENPTKHSIKSSDIRVRTPGNLRTSMSFSTNFWTRPSSVDKNGHSCPNFPGHACPFRGHERPQQANTRLFTSLRLQSSKPSPNYRTRSIKSTPLPCFIFPKHAPSPERQPLRQRGSKTPTRQFA